MVYTFEGEILPLPLKRLDFAVLAFLFYAMANGYNLRINGCVSRTLLANLEEFQRIWNKWLPTKYHPIQVSASEEIADPQSYDDGAAILAYSGGVDANFSLLSHYTGAIGRRARRIKAATLINGFDISLDQASHFDASACLARAVLADFNIPLTTISTNWKQNICGDWEMEFGAAIASCLFQLAGHASMCLLGSDEDYGSNEFLWGSNPISNPFICGEMRLETDGAGFTRTEKVLLLSKHPKVADNLRVCWEGPWRGRTDKANCGHCEKCIRTALNFYANGVQPGKSLAIKPTLKEIAFINARNTVQIAYLKDILSVAKSNGIRASWTFWLRVGILRARGRLVVRDYMYRPIKKALLLPSKLFL